MRGVQKLDLQPWAADVVGSTHDDWLRRNTKPHPDRCDLVAERRAFTGSVQAALQVCVHFSISVSFSIDMQAGREAGGACHQGLRGNFVLTSMHVGIGQFVWSIPASGCTLPH